MAHPTSLAGPFESGDLGPSSRAFVDFVAACGLRHWQVLPLAPVGPGFSPYSATSVFAGCAELVSLEDLAKDGLLDASDPALAPAAPGRDADLPAARERRKAALRRAFERSKSVPEARRAADEFAAKTAYWLDDFALFSALKEHHAGAPYYDWPEPLRRRDRAALAAFSGAHRDELAFHRFVQHRFQRDLDALVAYAHDKKVALMGDAPIYVAHDSADVWAHGELFQLDAHGDPQSVAGVPPDAFSEDGQLWGNPLYDWGVMQATGFGFFVARLEYMFRSFDSVRLDHFIGFSRYFAIARSEKTAKNGVFHDVPGEAFFRKLFHDLGPIELVAEDLGVVTDAVKRLRDQFELPGMSVLQFSFSPGKHAESSRPHRFPQNGVVYTGTHDNDTTAGWFASAPETSSEAGAKQWASERAFALDYLGLAHDTSPAAFAEAMALAALRSHVNTAMLPVQDVLGLGREARMNRPGIAQGNWAFRLLPHELSASVSSRLAEQAARYGRDG